MDRVRLHSSDVGLGVLAASSGVQVLMTPLFKDYAPSLSLKAIDPLLGLILAVFITMGGIQAVTGVLWMGRRISTGWVLEQVGWLFVAAGWIGYALLVAYTFPFSTIGYTMAFSIGVIAAFRAYVVWTIERSVRPRAEVAKTLRQDRGTE